MHSALRLGTAIFCQPLLTPATLFCNCVVGPVDDKAYNNFAALASLWCSMLYKIIQQFREEWCAIKRAPLAFVVFLGVGLGVGYGASNWYFNRSFSLHRNTSNAQALKNELRTRSERIAAEIRGICFDFQTQRGEAEKTWDLYKVPESERFGLIKSMANEYSQIFERKAKVDFMNLDTELRSRLGAGGTGGMVLLTQLNFDDPLIQVGSLCKYAEELEQLAKRLPG